MHWRLPFLIGLTCLVACAPSAGLSRNALGTAEVIRDFQADRGKDASYAIGEFVRFRFSLERAGFVTLVTMDSDRNTYELDRNISLPVGTSEFPLQSDRDASGRQAAYQITPPTGPQRMILIYTDAPAPGTARVRGVLSESDLERNVRAFMDASGAKARDIAEFTFTVTPKK